MTYALQAIERKIIGAALKHANSRRGQDTQRGDLRDWFERITRSEKEREAVALELNEMMVNEMRPEEIRLLPQLKKSKGLRRLEYQFELGNFRAMAAMATALILDDSYGLANRLKKCGNPKCGKFNLDLKPHGRPRTHCNAACKKAADATTSAERSRRHREKKAKRLKKRGK